MRTLQVKHLAVSIAALSVLAVTSLTAVSPASAQKRSRPTTTTTTRLPVPTTTTVVPTSVPTPSAFAVTSNFPDNWQIQISPSAQLGDAELLSGPTVGGPVIITVGDNGRVAFLRLVENSDYVIRYRNKIWIAATSSFITSPWVQFSFRTPTFDSLRPAAPQNVRVVASTATHITIGWDAVATAVRYDYSVNGSALVQTGTCSGPYCTPTDPLTATITRPATGASIAFSVMASRTPDLGCGPYCFPDNRFIASLPTSITITG